MDILEIQEWCESFAHVKTSVKWEHNLCFTIGEKMFCIISLDELFRVSFKVSDEVYEELTERQGVMPAPYLARAKWITVVQKNALTPREWKELLQNAYRLVGRKLSLKARKQLGID